MEHGREFHICGVEGEDPDVEELVDGDVEGEVGFVECCPGKRQIKRRREKNKKKINDNFVPTPIPNVYKARSYTIPFFFASPA